MSKRAMRALKKYPAFYMLRVTFGLGLFAGEGKNRGCGMGMFYHDSGDLVLYGAENFRKRGGLAYWQKKQHERFKATLADMMSVATWAEEPKIKKGLPRR